MSPLFGHDAALFGARKQNDFSKLKLSDLRIKATDRYLRRLFPRFWNNSGSFIHIIELEVHNSTLGILISSYRRRDPPFQALSIPRIASVPDASQTPSLMLNIQYVLQRLALPSFPSRGIHPFFSKNSFASLTFVARYGLPPRSGWFSIMSVR